MLVSLDANAHTETTMLLPRGKTMLNPKSTYFKRGGINMLTEEERER